MHPMTAQIHSTDYVRVLDHPHVHVPRKPRPGESDRSSVNFPGASMTHAKNQGKRIRHHRGLRGGHASPRQSARLPRNSLNSGCRGAARVSGVCCVPHLVRLENSPGATPQLRRSCQKRCATRLFCPHTRRLPTWQSRHSASMPTATCRRRPDHRPSISTPRQTRIVNPCRLGATVARYSAVRYSLQSIFPSRLRSCEHLPDREFTPLDTRTYSQRARRGGLDPTSQCISAAADTAAEASRSGGGGTRSS
eukprot:361342-Chlamydomonas_euryale.AAC.1